MDLPDPREKERSYQRGKYNVRFLVRYPIVGDNIIDSVPPSGVSAFTGAGYDPLDVRDALGRRMEQS